MPRAPGSPGSPPLPPGAPFLAALALAAVASAPLSAQVVPSGLLPRHLVEDCSSTPVLRAVGGGGRVSLVPGGTFRVPYGVAYEFRHAPGDEAAWMLARLDVGGVDRTLEARPLAGRSDCWSVVLPELPVDVPVTLVQSIGFPLDPARRTAYAAAIDALRDALIDSLFHGGRVDPTGASALWPALVLDLDLEGLVVREGDDLVPLSDRLRDLFVPAAPGMSRAVTAIGLGQALGRELRGVLDAPPPACGAPLDARQRGAIAALADALAAVSAAAPEQVAPLYRNGVLPLPDGLVVDARPALVVACPGLGGGVIARQLADVVPLTVDAFTPLQAAVAQAKRLVENSYRLSAEEAFPGATTTLQRFGQLDVVNAFFRGDDDTEQVRLLATFSFYPGALRYGGEVEPHGSQDRWVVTAGYSIATPVTTDDGSAGADDEDTAFTLGVGYRLNSALSLGGGRYFGKGEDGWYVSLAGDLGAVPFLRELFARQP